MITCSKCLMNDFNDSEIVFDNNNICNYCNEFEKRKKDYIFDEVTEKTNLDNLSKKLKKNYSNKKYDALLGLSGGVDSSYVAYLAHKLDLKILIVQLDNGWNSNIATSNIEKIVKKTGFDYFNYIINWEEFKDLQRSFLKSGVIDLELLTDHAITGVIFKMCEKFNIKYVLSGDNYMSENGLPKSWNWLKSDNTNIKDIQSKFGTKKIKTFPMVNFWRWYLTFYFNYKCEFIPILNRINYNKLNAIKVLKQYFNWQEYGGKHHESILTKFYQCYILPKKFNVDKRISHLSALIRSDQITRAQAINELNKPLFSGNQLQLEKEFFEKKLDFTSEEFDQIMKEKPINHDFYKSSKKNLKIVWKFSYIFSQFLRLKRKFNF